MFVEDFFNNLIETRIFFNSKTIDEAQARHGCLPEISRK